MPYLCHEVEFIYLGKMYGTGLNLHECTVLAKAAGSLNPQCLPWLHRSFLTDQAGHRHCSHECKFKPSLHVRQMQRKGCQGKSPILHTFISAFPC